MKKELNVTGKPVKSKYAQKKASLAAANIEEVVNTNEMPSVNDENPKEKKSIIDTLNYPPHITQLALLIKNNAEIRRFTALGILNYLSQKGEVHGKNKYVSFKWNKFAVKNNGLTREYSYNEKFFINALVAAFTSFSASAQRTIDAFTKAELELSISEAVNSQEIEEIIVMNEKYQNS